MPWKGGFKKVVSRTEFLELVEKVNVTWPKHVMIHNTWKPTLKQTLDYLKNHSVLQRLDNFGAGDYKKRNVAGPHIFIFPVDGDNIGLGCPLELTGFGSPGFNHNAWHIEGTANFDIDDDDAGPGFIVKDTMAFVAAALLNQRGLEADPHILKFHGEDPRTTHKGCPGSDLVKSDFLARVQAYQENITDAGDHGDFLEEKPYPAKEMFVDTKVGDPLNVRDQGGMAGKPVAKLDRGAKVKVIGEAQNAATVWYQIEKPKGWVSGKFLVEAEPPKAVEKWPEPQGKDRPKAAFEYLKQKGIPDFKAAAAVGRGMREAYTTLKDDVWGDQGTAFGIFQWRGPRLEHMLKFAAERQQPRDYFYMQIDFFLEEMATSPEVKLARQAWDAAKTFEDAVKALMHYERPRGYKPHAPERGDGYKETLNFGLELLGKPKVA